MVPESYHAFYSGCVSVAGALIGLLFVAISIAPHKLSGDDASTAFQVRAGVAFTSLLNALLISLVALLPRDDLGLAAGILAISGASSTVGLAAAGLRGIEWERRRVVLMIVRLGAIFVVFVAQFVNAFWLSPSPKNTGPVSIQALLVMICFLVAIDRAWELLGGTDSGLVSVFADVVRRRRAADTDASGDE